MAYRANISKRDRGGAVAAVIAIHLGLLFVLLNLNGKGELAGPDSALRVFNLNQPPPPPPPPPQQTPQLRPKEKEAASAPPNVKSQATPVEAPRPKVIVPPLPQIAASQTPREGTMATQGAAFAGPGPGAGGTGNGTGSGAGGTGSGGGGDNGVAEPPHLATPVLNGRDFPSDTLAKWPSGATVFLSLRIDERGYVSECAVNRGTGVASIDSQVCNVAHDRLRFRPAINRGGQAVAGWFGYAQRAPR